VALRWLNRDLYQGDLTDLEYDARFEAWRTHHAGLPLADGAERLLDLSIHDATIVGWSINQDRQLVSLSLSCWLTVDGDEPRQVIVTYRGASIETTGPDELASLLDNPQTTLLYQEIDATETGWEQNILVWRGKRSGVADSGGGQVPTTTELCIRFTEVDVADGSGEAGT
jgi:hypothetical protein